MKACNKKYVAILNNDTWLMPSWNQVLLTRLAELDADMIGPYYDETPFDPIETPKKAQAFIKRNVGKFNKNWVSVLMFFKRELFNSIGEFDERFFVTYEDTDFRERMDRAGKKYFQVGDCYIWHLSKGTRDTQNLPTNYEQEGLHLFIDKWKFDPRIREHGLDARLKRRWSKIKNKMGYF
ncbi:MAG: hypothetical protein HY072_09600 [Deltaproteobacteria bacterium]|nr:hypothetical protein [Deltaproteobacteria bacterium]